MLQIDIRYRYIVYNAIHMYSGITSGRVLDGELLYTQILEVNLFAFAYRLFVYIVYTCKYIVHIEQCALPVSTIMTLWQLLHLGTGCSVHIDICIVQINR